MEYPYLPQTQQQTPLINQSIPDDYHTMTVSVYIPAIQSLITGLTSGTAVASLAGLAAWPPGWTWLQTAGASWTIIQAITWILLLRRWASFASPTSQPAFDTPESDPATIHEPKTIRLEIITNAGRTTQYMDLPITEAQLTAIAQGLTHGIHFTEAAWTGKGKLLSRSQFRQIRDELVKRQLLVPASLKDHRQGYVLNRAGSELIRQFAAVSNSAASPTLSTNHH